jgi:hypothetical protein
MDARFRRPPPAFGGTINLDAQNSTPYWQPQVVPPKGAPNILLIITDDVGFAAPSTFGGVIPTPTLEANASAPSAHKTQYFEMFGNRAHSDRCTSSSSSNASPSPGTHRKC